MSSECPNRALEACYVDGIDLGTRPLTDSSEFNEVDSALLPMLLGLAE